MSISVKVTNLSSSVVSLDDIYVNLGASGASSDNITFARSMAELDSMQNLKKLVDAGTVSVVLTASADNVDILSVPIEQHGASTTVDADVVQANDVAVTFPKAYPASTTPRVLVSLDITAAPNARGAAYVKTVTNTGFTAVIDITTQGGATTTAKVLWAAVM